MPNIEDRIARWREQDVANESPAELLCDAEDELRKLRTGANCVTQLLDRVRAAGGGERGTMSWPAAVAAVEGMQAQDEELRAEVERLEHMICPHATFGEQGAPTCDVVEKLDMAEGAMLRVHEWRREPNSTDMALALEYVAEYIEKHLPDEVG